MDFFPLAQSHPAIACILYAALWAAISAAVLWPFSLDRVVNRRPIVFAVIMLLLLAESIELLPLAVPHFFESRLGHSINAWTTTREAGGTLFSEPWLERWQETSDTVFLWISFGGAVWGIVNLCRRRAWVWNSIAVAYVALTWFIALTHASPL